MSQKNTKTKNTKKREDIKKPPIKKWEDITTKLDSKDSNKTMGDAVQTWTFDPNFFTLGEFQNPENIRQNINSKLDDMNIMYSKKVGRVIQKKKLGGAALEAIVNHIIAKHTGNLNSDNGGRQGSITEEAAQKKAAAEKAAAAEEAAAGTEVEAAAGAEAEAAAGAEAGAAAEAAVNNVTDAEQNNIDKLEKNSIVKLGFEKEEDEVNKASVLKLYTELKEEQRKHRIPRSYSTQGSGKIYKKKDLNQCMIPVSKGTTEMNGKKKKCYRQCQYGAYYRWKDDVEPTSIVKEDTNSSNNANVCRYHWCRLLRERGNDKKKNKEDYRKLKYVCSRAVQLKNLPNRLTWYDAHSVVQKINPDTIKNDDCNTSETIQDYTQGLEAAITKLSTTLNIKLTNLGTKIGQISVSDNKIDTLNTIEGIENTIEEIVQYLKLTGGTLQRETSDYVTDTIGTHVRDKTRKLEENQIQLNKSIKGIMEQLTVLQTQVSAGNQNKTAMSEAINQISTKINSSFEDYIGNLPNEQVFYDSKI